jgi:O-antigen/teichoic acid export membrane protein
MGCQEGYISSLWSTIGQVGSLLAVIVVIRYEGGLPALVLAMSGVPIVVTAFSAVLLFVRQHPDLRPRWALVSSQTAGQIIRTGWWFFLIQIIAAFHYSADSLIIAHLLGPAEVSRYSVGMRLAIAVPTVVGMWLVPLWPAVSEAAARRDWHWIRRTFSRTFLGSVGIVGIGAVGLTMFGDAIVRAWVGPDVLLGTGLLAGFGVFMLASAMSGPVAMFMNGLGIIRVQVLTSLLMAVVSLFARIHFAPTHGVTSVILSNALTQIALVSLPSWWILRSAMRTTEVGNGR